MKKIHEMTVQELREELQRTEQYESNRIRNRLWTMEVNA